MGDAATGVRTMFDTSMPNLARMDDYFLGGKDNFAADRVAAEQVLAIAPEIRIMAKERESFLERTVRYLVGEGVSQFLVLGSGLPGRRNVHQVAQSLLPDARVAYVADDPVVLSHCQALLVTNSSTVAVGGDVLRPDELLADPDLLGLIDFDRPVAALIASALQFIPDEDEPFKNVARLCDSMAAGSHLVVAHAVFDTRPDVAGPLLDVYRRIVGPDRNPWRTREQVLRFFDGLELVDPGLVLLRRWRPDNPLTAQSPEKTWIVGGVARKTAD